MKIIERHDTVLYDGQEQEGARVITTVYRSSEVWTLTREREWAQAPLWILVRCLVGEQCSRTLHHLASLEEARVVHAQAVLEQRRTVIGEGP